jgi:sec-independent protein translocase protein TatB
MFDIGFSEILVIAVVALIVIGPERLPGVARTLGHLLGRMQRYVNDVKADIAREMEMEELRKLKSKVEDAAQSMEQAINREVSDAQSHLNHAQETLTNEAEALRGQIEAKPANDAAAPTPAVQPPADPASQLPPTEETRKQA